ncbi:chorismate--pyruvate lyase family protein [Bordetella avium]|uniref:Probable chorismate pyruvate-lyase n=1 Tax=Bordetella avium (strain 197N) TaxID=360910 RepID=UBIC_BORA1|nr:chorismate lyase [Bordetella avium]Q2L1H6.1 RecName: Full=Probable chorismate pyruvate-lyase; Short=CL; Short=CPL [Bordetella avium 197N]AZY49030.1 chorismate--pyruvate lyase [Bordetella avium]AZY52387.1 chorismate--pyruvate lyase [Bordetella avium]RIQ14269.1 chorismate lyase [Bordetella avium]RIQ18146.1 chorismate lyase [Bordetella avium]RIQ36616.1 chorismate lyase [Bordetella avium]
MTTKYQAPLAAGWLIRAPSLLSPTQRHWLFRPGALTAGLRQLGKVQLRVVSEHAEGASLDEARAMLIAPGSPVWVREVLMSVDGIDSVPARSLTPLAASHGSWQGMRRLLTRPLADMLYHDRGVTRSPFVCRRLSSPLPFYRMALPPNHDGSAIWARRSVFWRHGQPLLVAECFLPDFWRKVTLGRAIPPLKAHDRRA